MGVPPDRARPRPASRKGRAGALALLALLPACSRESPVEAVTKVLEFSGVRENLNAVALAPDGSLVAIADIDGGILLRQVPSGAERWRAKVSGANSILAFSPDGSLLAAAGNGAPAVGLLETETGQVRSTIPVGGAECLAFDRSGRSLVIGASGTLHVVDLESEEIERTLPGAHAGDDVCAAAFSPRGELLATASLRGQITLWEWPSLVPRKSSATPPALEPMTPRSIAVGGKGPRVALNGIEGKGSVWDSARDRIERVFGTHPDGPGRVPPAEMLRSLAFTEDGEWLFAPDAGDLGIRLLHASSRTSHAAVRGDVPYYKAVAIAVPAKTIALLHPSDRDGRGPYGLQVWKFRYRGERATVPPAEAVAVPSRSPGDARARLESLGVPAEEDSLFAQIREKDEVTVRLLLKAEVSPNTTESSGHTPATLAVEVDAPAILRALADASADLNRPGPDGSPPLHVAAEHGYLACARALVEARTLLGQESDRGHPINVVTPSVDRDARDARGATALLVAVQNRRTEMIRFLLDQGFDPTPGAGDGETPLLAAIDQDDLGLLRLLLQKGANEDVPDAKGRTPLMRACIAGRMEMVEALCRAGADVSRTDHDGKTPLAHALEGEWTDIVDYLKKGGAPAAPPEVPPHPGRRTRGPS
ncbi:MAG: ankyrin repeat domain-containing protein [Planctomycetes bacterium]|nr:ankyrin repeat domain-containing protein [Planctomycetota bacterium]